MPVEEVIHLSSSSDISVSDDDDALVNDKPSSLNGKDNRNNQEERNVVNPVLLEHAKKRLSKWAARLFDPNRPKGLVEGPQTIPLNDEFLSAFGKREKEYDKQLGRDLQVDQTIGSDDDDDDNDDDDIPIKSKQSKMNKSKPVKETKTQTKIKVSNLAYSTTEETLTKACLKYGPLVEVNLILDKDREGQEGVHNSGRGYITFESEEDAQACIEGLKHLDGRQLRCALAKERGKQNANTSGGGFKKSASTLNRYWEKDISTICFRCGQVGHISDNCKNPAKAKPCPLCAGLDHVMRLCPFNRICFNCGIPGHVNRDCTFRRGMPRRIICGICFQQGHHRTQCRSSAHESAPAIQNAICMDCGKPGHFSCQQNRWFYGLQGMSCFNCGTRGHSGYDCRRPNLQMLHLNSELTTREIERATTDSM